MAVPMGIHRLRRRSQGVAQPVRFTFFSTCFMAIGLNALILHTRCFQLGIVAGVIAVTAVGQTPFLFPGLLRELFPDFSGLLAGLGFTWVYAWFYLNLHAGFPWLSFRLKLPP